MYSKTIDGKKEGTPKMNHLPLDRLKKRNFKCKFVHGQMWKNIRKQENFYNYLKVVFFFQ